MTPQMLIAITAKKDTKAFGDVVVDAQAAQGQITRTGRAAGAAMGDASFHTANLASQFNDIGVMLASGQSPLLLALQQGTQISQVLGPMGAGQAAGALKVALLSLLSPVSLITIGSIAAGAAAVQWLMGMREDARSVEEQLDEQLERIREIAVGYDDAAQAAEDYIERRRARPEGAVVSDLEAERASALEEIDSALSAIEDKEAQISTDLANLRLGGALFQDILDASSGLDELNLSASSTDAEIDALITSLTELSNSDAPERARAYADDLLALIDQLTVARAEAGSLAETLNNMPSEVAVRIRLETMRADFGEAMSGLSDILPDPRSRFDIMRAENESLFDKASVNATSMGALNAVVEQYEENLRGIAELEAEHAAESSGSAGALERQANAYRSVIEELEHETALVGISAREQEVLNNIRAAGVDAMSEQGLQIRALTEELYDQQQAAEATEKAQQKLNQAWEGFGKKAGNTIGDLINGTKNLGQALGDILISLGQIALQQINFAGMGTGGNFLQGLIGGIFGGFMAEGGPVEPGKAYIVGEKRPEVFVPRESGYILPSTHQGGAAQVLNLTQQFVFDGTITRGDVQAMAMQAGAQAVDSVKLALPGWQMQLQRDGALA
jgi:hypothetical protein